MPYQREKKKKDPSTKEDAEQIDDDWEDVSGICTFAIQITQVEANIVKCDKRIADEQFAVEENGKVDTTSIIWFEIEI